MRSKVIKSILALSLAMGGLGLGGFGSGTALAATMKDVTSISSNGGRSIAIKSDGSIRHWGTNLTSHNYGYKPMVFNSSFANTKFVFPNMSTGSLAVRSDGAVAIQDRETSQYVELPSLSNVVATATNGTSTLAINGDKTLWGWGSNAFGQLGTGANVSTTTPVKTSGLTDVVSVAMGTYHSLAVKSDGTLWYWGFSTNGALGNGSNNNIPTLYNNINNVKSVATGNNHTLVLKKDGSVWAWGTNTDGQLGDGTTTKSVSPVRVSALDNANIIAVYAGNSYSMALDSTGKVWRWGKYSNVMLENEATGFKTPVQSQSISGIKELHLSTTSIYGDSVIAAKTDGTLWAWGSNTYAQLGDGTNVSKTTPAQVGVNTVPVLTLTTEDNQTLTESSTLTLAGNVSDSDHMDVTAVKYKINNGVVQTITSITHSGAKSNPPYTMGIPVDQSFVYGANTVEVWAEDSESTSKVETLTVNVAKGNTAPVVSLDTLPEQIVGSGEFHLSGTVTDVDNDQVIVSATVGGITKTATIVNTLNSASWKLTWLGTEVANGTYANIPVTFSSTDVTDQTLTSTNTIKVDHTVPNPPVTPGTNFDILPGHNKFGKKSNVGIIADKHGNIKQEDVTINGYRFASSKF